MTTSPSTFRRTVQITKTVITTTVLFATPFALMAQPAPAIDHHVEATNTPAWNRHLADQFPACEAIREGVVTPAVIVVRSTGIAQRLTTDRAFALNADDERANNVWVVGTCA